jgi:hypothetical protein
MDNSVKTLILTAAISGLLSGTVMRAQEAAAPTNSKASVNQNYKAGVKATSYIAGDADKHSCKGKNDCKGQGGCKTGDNGCKGKNSCKGKGGCATDGSKPPQAS